MREEGEAIAELRDLTSYYGKWDEVALNQGIPHAAI